MQWSLQHQILYAAVVLLVMALVGAGSWFVFFYTPPSCFDNILNQGEEGIDCGGSCSLLCVAPRISASWARAVKVAPGVYHAVAMVRNPRSDAGTEDLPYTFSLFDAENILIAERRGTFTLEPGETVPLFEANIVTGERIPARTFISFGEGAWHTMERAPDPIRITSQNLDREALRLSASATNTTPEPAHNVAFIALLYGADDTLIAASRTVINTLPARTTQSVTFTWQEPFTEPVIRADIIARVRK